MSLSLISDKSAFLHDGYIAAIENYYAPIAVKCTLFPMRIASLLLAPRSTQYLLIVQRPCYLATHSTRSCSSLGGRLISMGRQAVRQKKFDSTTSIQ